MTADEFIQRTTQTQILPDAGDVQQICDHAAAAEMSRRSTRVRGFLVGQTFQGVSLSGELPNDFLHLARRVL